MASCSGGGSDPGGLLGGGSPSRDELKSQFSTREGVYRLLSAIELSRSIRPPPVPYGTLTTQPPNTGPSPPLRLSFVTINPTSSLSILNSTEALDLKSTPVDTETTDSASSPNKNNGTLVGNDLLSETDYMDRTTTRFCFNLGKELFVFPYLDSSKIADLSKPLDKRIYKGTFPTCHDFNSVLATQDNLSLLIGFSGGQIQLVEPVSKEVNKLYNEDRMIDKTRVTCIRWVPKSSSMFLVAHSSGQLYLYNVELSCGTAVPHYQVVKTGPGYTVSNCKSKTPRNPLTKWTMGEGAINEFAFSPCGLYLAIVSQDGFLRILRYEGHELVGITRSYFGGLLCVCWSADSKYICVGGEDDLVTIWSFKERRVVARGQGHRSWVSVVAFDPYTSSHGESDNSEDFTSSGIHHSKSNNDCHSSGVYGSESASSETLAKNQCCSPTVSSSSVTSNNKPSKCEYLTNHNHNHNCDSSTTLKDFLANNRVSRTSDSINLRLSVSETSGNRVPICYRLGSVSQDTQLCLWELTEDVLKQPFGRSRPTTTSGGTISVRALGDTSPSTFHSNPTSTSTKSQNILHVNGSKNCLTTSSSMSYSISNPNATTNPNREREVIIEHNAINSNSSTRTNSTISETQNTTSTNSKNGNGSSGHSHHSILNLRFGGLSFGGGDKDKDSKNKEHKRNFSLTGAIASTTGKGSHNQGSSSGSGNQNGTHTSSDSGSLSQVVGLANFDDPMKLIGTQACPRLDECPLLEPLVCKKISHERLTTLIFREECIITGCQDGVLCSWARPGEDFRITNYSSSNLSTNRTNPNHSLTTQHTTNNLAQDDIFSRLYSKSENIEPL